MTIVIIAGTYQSDRCGVAHYTARLREELQERGIESIVLTTHQAAQMNNDPRVLGVVQDWYLSELIPLVRAVQATGADLLHIQHAAGTYGFDRAIFLLPLLLKLSRWQAPIVTTVHEYGWWEWKPQFVPPQLLEWLKTWGQQQGWWDREDGFLLTQSEAIITTNRDTQQVLYQRLPHLKSIVHQIPIGANVEVVGSERTSARQTLRRDCGWHQEVQVIVFFGFLHPVKGLETLLTAFKQVLSLHPQARLLLIGGVESLALRGEEASHYWQKLQTLIAQLDLNKMVQMTGYLEAEAASAKLAGADIGVLPFNHGVTLKSGSLLTLMAHVLPVIATRSAPSDPDLNDKRLLRLISPRNQEALVTELDRLLADASLRNQLGAAGYNFSRQFTWSSIAEAHLKVYRTVL